MIPLKYFSIFSGIGGFEYGIQCACNKQFTEIKQDREGRNRITNEMESNVLPSSRAAALCIGFSEIDKYAIQIYQKHFKEHKNYGDAKRIIPEELPDFGLLVGGFPCQSFSIAGKRGGFKDTRGTLFFDIARIVKVKRPGLVCLENVKGLLSHDKGNTFATILSTLDELGYDCQWSVLNSKNFGVPQNRERVFIIGHLRGTSRPEVFPIAQSSEQGLRPSEPDTRPEGDKSDSINTIRRTPLTDNMRIRRLTPTECERLQGFPDGWTEGISDTQRYKCLGNAVTVNVIEAIMRRLL